MNKQKHDDDQSQIMTTAITATPERTARNLNQGVSKRVGFCGLKPLDIK